MAAETIRIEIPIETLDKTDPSLSQVIRKFGKMETAADRAGAASQRAGGQVSQFDRSAERTQRTLSKWMKEKYEILLEARDRISPVLNTLRSGMKAFAGRTWDVTMKAKDLVTAPVRGILNLLKNPVFQAGAVLGVSIGLTDTIHTFQSFEAAMSQVEAISGATGAEMERLTDKAKEMGATTKFTATEAASAFNYMAMAGWEAEDMMGGIEGILNLAAASGTDLAQTSDIVTDALTAFGMQANEAGRFSDVLAAASSKSNTNVALMGETFKYAGAMAGTLGYSIEDVALATGLMANAGIKGNMSGTALNSIFTRLSTNTNGATDALKDLGIAYFNADGSARAFGDIMKELRTATANYTDEQKANLANTVAGTYAQKGFLAILNATEKDYEKLSSAVNNADGAAGRMAEIMMDNLDGAITLLQSATDGVKLSFGERLAPYVRGFAEWLTESMPMVEEALDSLMDAVDKHVDAARRKLDGITKSEEWQDADFFGKAKILWDDFIVEPFGEWWNGTGKAKIAEIAGNIGSGLGAGLRTGIMTLLGIDVSNTLDEGASVGASFARGFSEGFDVSAITSKLGEAFKNLFSSAGKLLPGGESADLSSFLSAALLMKMARPMIGIGRGAYSLGKGLFGAPEGGGASLIGSLIGSAGTGTGLLGFGADAAIKLGAGNLAGGASLSAGALSAVGLGATAGGIAGGATIISGGIDFYKALKSEDKEEAAAYGESGAWKTMGVGAGALAGASIGAMFGGIGAVPGALIGAGIGGIAGWVKGNKVKEEYQENVEEMQREAEKAQKIFEATGFDIEDVKFKSKDLQKAMEDTEVTTEQFAQYFQESCADVMKNAFGDMKLSLTEVKELAGDLAFGGMAEGLEAFRSAAETAENSLASFQNEASSLAKMNWNAGLGLKLSVEDQEGYRESIDSYVASAQDYLKDSHYEATVALRLLTKGADTKGLDAMYGDYETQINEIQTETQRVLSEALSDGVISTEDVLTVKIGDTVMKINEADAIAQLQEQIMAITEKVSQAEENAGFESLKIKYGGAALDADSFAQLQTELQDNVAQSQQNYDDALKVSLRNINLELEEGAISQEEYDNLYQQLEEGYNNQIGSLTLRMEEFQLDAIASAFSKELDGILPDLEGSMTEKLSQAMNHALAVKPDVSEWDASFMANMFDLSGLEGEVQRNLEQLLKSTAATIPQSYASALNENMLTTVPSMEEMMDSQEMLAPYSKAGNTYGTAMTAGIQEGIEAGSPQLRSSAEHVVTSTFNTPFSVTAKVNITPDYNITAGAGAVGSALASMFSAGGSGIGTGGAGKSGAGKGSEKVSGHAAGGYVSGGPQLSWLAEEGYGEFIIPTNPSRRARALELYEQAGTALGVSAHADGGYAGGPIVQTADGGQEGNDGGYAAQSYFPASSGTAPAVSNVPVQVNVNLSPEIVINSNEGQSEEGVVQAIRKHMRELADEVGGEIAGILIEVFGNTPLKG